MSLPKQRQEPPGVTAEMTPKPDHGEESHKGCGKLAGKAAVITGGGSGIGRGATPPAREGADVLITHLPEEEEDARETKRWVAALANFTANLGQPIAEKGIRVDCVVPGPIWTPLIPSTMPPEQVENSGQDVPVKRSGQPKEVATLFVFLASDDASYVTGARCAATGGTPIL